MNWDLVREFDEITRALAPTNRQALGAEIKKISAALTAVKTAQTFYKKSAGEAGPFYLGYADRPEIYEFASIVEAAIAVGVKPVSLYQTFSRDGFWARTRGGTVVVARTREQVLSFLSR